MFFALFGIVASFALIAGPGIFIVLNLDDTQ